MVSLERENITKKHSVKEWYEILSNEEFDNIYTYEGKDLGSIYFPNETIFKLWAPTATKVSLNLYNTGNYKDKNDSIPILTKQMNYTTQGVWELKLKGDYLNKYYTYLIEVNGIINESNDPYGKACGVNGKRSMIINLKRTDPKDWDKDKHIFYNFNQSIIYELHIGDFSNSPSSGIEEKYRGKYLAFTIKNTYLNGEEKNKNKPTCLDYLKNLGITTVQIMPTYDFGSVEEDIKSLENEGNNKNDSNYNWGYDPINYNCPEGSYSTNPYDGSVRINELKQMIQSLHNENISVIMDVVYNHTYKFIYSNFQKCVPYYYYRQKPDGKRSNGSGCGNDIATERRMVHNFIINSVLYWITEYHFDGFRFDLMGLLDVDLMNDLRNKINTLVPNGNQIILYGEPWNMKTFISKKNFNQPLCNKNNFNNFHQSIAFFHDELRDSIKGSTFNKPEKGFISGNLIKEKNLNINIYEIEKLSNDFKKYFLGGINVEGIWDSIKTDRLINYISCHDNNTLWDKLIIAEYNLQEELSNKEKEFDEDDPEYDDINIPEFSNIHLRYKNVDYFIKKDEKVVKINKLGAAIVLLSFGIPFFLAGEEGGRTKLGESNSYNFPKSLNQIDWERIYIFEDLVYYYKKLIEIRKILINCYNLNKVKFNNINDLPIGIIGFGIQRIRYGVYKEIIVLFNSTENDFVYKITNKSKYKIILSDNINNNSDIDNKMFIVGPISAGVIGILDPNYKKEI